MNDRAVSLLDNYDFTVLRTWKGRGAILFETETGNRMLCEYSRSKEKLEILNTLQDKVEESGVCKVDHYVRTKEGQLYVKDRDDTVYIVKEYHEGTECNIRDIADVIRGVKLLARLHRILEKTPCEGEWVKQNPAVTLETELQKHNRELTRIYRYLAEKGQRSEFELYLLHHYKPFLEQAKNTAHLVENDTVLKSESEDTAITSFCHGDYQYHNILFSGAGEIVTNFEKASIDAVVRDLYYYIRKAMEKNGWTVGLCHTMIEEYDRVRTLSLEEKKQLYYRLLYPEKFWKIVNYYYNTAKSWIPGKNSEKLSVLLAQEKEKQAVTGSLFI